VRHRIRKISYNGSMNKRNLYSANFKAQVVIEVLREEATVNEIAAKYGIHPAMLGRWKKEFTERASDDV
jgi:transposase